MISRFCSTVWFTKALSLTAAPAKLWEVINRLVIIQLWLLRKLLTMSVVQEVQLLDGLAGSKSTVLSVLL